MAAANTDKFKKAKRRFSTTVGTGGFTASATTLPLTSTSGLDTDTAITLVIEPGGINEEVITGVVNGSNIVNCVRGKEGTSDVTHTAGAAVSMYFTETHWDDLINGILVEHKQDGTHGTLTSTSISTGAITATTVSGTTGTFSGNVSDNGQTLQTIRNETMINFVASGCVWSGNSYGSTRVASMTSGVVYIGGVRLTVSSVTSRTFTASKDTYVDVDGTGALVYTEVANNAASPALSSDSLRLAIIVTGASSIANAGSVNQGQNDKVLPIASSTPYTKTDSLGNIICNRDPQSRLLGYRYVAVSVAPATGTYNYSVLSCPVIVPANRQIKVTAKIQFGETNTTTNKTSEIYIREDGTNITAAGKNGHGFNIGTVAATNITGPIAIVYRDPSAGLHTYGASVYLQGADMSINGGWISVELM